MKRKLSTALACMEGSDLLVLDEPTSGMDPVSKQHVSWLRCAGCWVRRDSV